MSYEVIIPEAQIVKAAVNGRSGFVMRSVTPDHFEDPYMRLAFDLCNDIYRRSFDVTPSTLRDEFLAQGWSEEHADGVISSISSVPDAGNLEHTISVVGRIQLRKEFVSMLDKAQKDAGKPGDISPAIARVIEFAAKRSNLQGKIMTDYDTDLMASVGEISEPGLPLGFGVLDMYWELYPGTFNILMGKRGEGKTAMALNAARNLRLKGIPSLFLSFEMRTKDLRDRLMAMDTGINSNSIKTGRLSDLERQAIEEFKRKERDPYLGRVHWLDAHSLTDEAIHAVVREAVQNHGVQVTFIDYLQKVPTAKWQPPKERVAAVGSELTRVSLATNSSILALAQPKRLEDPTQMPEIDDLMWSSEPANDATSGVSIRTDPHNPHMLDYLMWKNRYGDRYQGQLEYNKQTQRITA